MLAPHQAGEEAQSHLMAAVEQEPETAPSSLPACQGRHTERPAWGRERRWKKTGRELVPEDR